MNTQILKYNEQEVEFEFNDSNVMVNATQMAKIFGKQVNEFLSNETTKKLHCRMSKKREFPFFNYRKRR